MDCAFLWRPPIFQTSSLALSVPLWPFSLPSALLVCHQHPKTLLMFQSCLLSRLFAISPFSHFKKKWQNTYKIQVLILGFSELVLSTFLVYNHVPLVSRSHTAKQSSVPIKQLALLPASGSRRDPFLFAPSQIWPV